MSQVASISATQASSMLESNSSVRLIDVRTPAEFGSLHASGARNIPLDIIQSASLQGDHALSKNEPVCLLCEKGGRATLAAGHLLAAGFDRVHVIEGGTQAWVAAGLPIVKGKRSSISIERQVRIGAGSLVLMGVILGVFVNTVFLALPAFVGAGLIFAGVTDWCGMGLLLARAPWNR